jgi:hypothetical protein
MSTAARVLNNLAAKDASLLPRYQSDRSGELFARLVAVEQNLAASKNKSLPIEARFANYGDYLKSASQIAKLYFAAFVAKKLEGSEIVEFMGAVLRMEVIGWPLVDEYFLTLDESQPSGRDARTAEKTQLKQGLATAIASVFQSLTEKENYRPSERLRLLAYLQDSLPPLLPRLSPAARQEIVVRSEAMSRDPDLEELRPGLERLHKKVRDAVEHLSAP